MSKGLKIFLWVIVAIIVIGGSVLLYNYNKDSEVIATDGDQKITRGEYDKDAKYAKDILTQLADISDVQIEEQKIDWATFSKKIYDFFAKYPSLTKYALKFAGANNKQAIINKGIKIAGDKSLQPQIANRAIASNEPVWVAIIDQTFDGV